MSSGESSPASSGALLYAQDDSFCSAVGEPLPLDAQSRIVIAKWDVLYAEALRLACERTFPATPLELVRHGAELLASLRRQPAELVLCGLTFADADGVDLLETIARERLARRVFVVSGRKDEHTLQALRRVRFDGFFDPFTENAEGLAMALRQVAGGRGYVSASLSGRMLAQRSAGVLGNQLTPAELQVFCIIGDGSDDQEAAARLGVSEATIATHRRNLMRKLGVPTSAKLVREAVRLGVVRITPEGEIVRPGLGETLAASAAQRARKKAHDNPSAAGR